MIRFQTTLLKFGKMGEKTGWTYFEISASQAKRLKPGVKVSFRVKGSLDKVPIKGVAILPMGEGNFILPVNGDMRKKLKKKAGERIEVKIEADNAPLRLHPGFAACLKDDPDANKVFEGLPKGHQNYFNKWILSAKTEPTQAKRIAQALHALSRGLDFVGMMRLKDKEVWWS